MKLHDMNTILDEVMTNMLDVQKNHNDRQTNQHQVKENLQDVQKNLFDRQTKIHDINNGFKPISIKFFAFLQSLDIFFFLLNFSHP